ncbi:MAG: hypothetical protein CM1200mP28_01520 [Deltaproteobacteria bacterium]|nr:MAG: hypothetical protein CM1200mP28_01520 [Deltaproteobacteria bacterium]
MNYRIFLIEINVLSPLAPFPKPEDVKIGKHGLMINKGSKGAIFLPEVAVSNGWDLHTFLEELCRKANLSEGSWHDCEAELYVFESEDGMKMSSLADFVFRQLQPLFFSGDAQTAHERMLSSVEMVFKNSRCNSRF